MASKRDVNTCEHGDHPAPEGKRFCSTACARCEHESEDEETGCDGICLRSRAIEAKTKRKAK